MPRRTVENSQPDSQEPMSEHERIRREIEASYESNMIEVRKLIKDQFGSPGPDESNPSRVENDGLRSFNIKVDLARERMKETKPGEEPKWLPKEHEALILQTTIDLLEKSKTDLLAHLNDLMLGRG